MLMYKQNIKKKPLIYKTILQFQIILYQRVHLIISFYNILLIRIFMCLTHV